MGSVRILKEERKERNWKPEEGREDECVQADDDEDDEDEDEDSSHEKASLKMNQTQKKDHQQRHHPQYQQCEATAEELEHLKKRRASLKRNNTDDSEVEQRMARIFHEINYSVTDSVDDLAKFNTSHSSAEAPAPPAAASDQSNDSGTVSRVEVETQTTGDDGQVNSRTQHPKVIALCKVVSSFKLIVVPPTRFFIFPNVVALFHCTT